MDGPTKNTDSQFISFNDFPSMSHAGNPDGQLNTGAAVHQPFHNLSNDSTGIGIVEDLQGITNKTEGIHNYIRRKIFILVTMHKSINIVLIFMEFRLNKVYFF